MYCLVRFVRDPLPVQRRILLVPECGEQRVGPHVLPCVWIYLYLVLDACLAVACLKCGVGVHAPEQYLAHHPTSAMVLRLVGFKEWHDCGIDLTICLEWISVHGDSYVNIIIDVGRDRDLRQLCYG